MSTLSNRQSCLLLVGLAVVALVACLVRDSTFTAGSGNSIASQMTTTTPRRIQASSSSPTTPVAVFFNVYIPPAVEDDAAELERVLDIFREQIMQVGKESALSHRENVVVHLITIGAKVKPSTISVVCRRAGVNCMHERHYEQGFEMVTQQHLLEFCQREENESSIVGYIHNKGSYHPMPIQDKRRRGLTAAALSEECMSMLDEDKCNVCGNGFKSIWGPFWQCNFWSARCDYVKNLVPPSELVSMNTLAMETRPKEMTMDLYFRNGMDPSYEKRMVFALPKGRFAAEHFVGTHPKLVPCSSKGGNWWSNDPPGDLRSHVARAGGLDDAKWFFEEHLGREMKTGNKHLTEYWFLPGLLWRYHVLYNEMPPSDSWIWRHFPDGENWKAAVEQFGYPQAFYHRVANELNGAAVPW